MLCCYIDLAIHVSVSCVCGVLQNHSIEEKIEHLRGALFSFKSFSQIVPHKLRDSTPYALASTGKVLETQQFCETMII